MADPLAELYAEHRSIAAVLSGMEALVHEARGRGAQIDPTVFRAMDAAERSMHGGVPGGAGQYHVNISLFDAKSGAAIRDAQVEVQVDQAGMTSESKKLEPMVINDAPSYGNYFRMKARTSYLITVRVRKPDSPLPVEARFEQRIN